MKHLSAFFAWLFEFLGKLSIVGLIISLALQVITRYIFEPLPWTEEFARYCFIWAAYFGAAIVSRENGHITVDFFTNLLPETIRKALNIFGKCLSVIFAAILAWSSLPLFKPMLFQYKSSAMQMPMIFLFISIPIAAVAMVFYDIANIRRMIVHPQTSTKEA